MNPLQLEQILPQTAQILHSIDTMKENDAGGISFADALKAAQAEEQTADADSARMSKTEANDEPEVENIKSENNAEKVSKKSSEDKDDSKISKSSENVADEKLAAEATAIQNVKNEDNSLQVSMNRTLETIDVENISAEENLNTENEINQKVLSWLTKSDKVQAYDDKEMTSDEFAELIDAAVEFIPGNKSEEEKLLNAQNLSVNDPENFLAQMEQSEIPNLESRNLENKNLEVKAKKQESKLAVHDLRTQKTLDPVNSEKTVQKTASKKELTLEYQQKNDSTMQVTMELANKAESNILSNNAQAAGANGSAFQSMLSNAVQENAPEFVKAGNIILKDNNQGTINLILKPEALGNVKISLNLNDKVISGQIAVQSKEAMDAFRESIDALKQAFTESGFETGSFDLSFSNQQSFAQSGSEGQNQQASFMAKKVYGEIGTSTASESAGAEASYTENTSYGVNIVA